MERLPYYADVDKRTAALLAGASCGVGAALLMLRRTLVRRNEVQAKIQRARDRKTESLQRAELALLRHRETHPTLESDAILTLSLPELTKNLRDGSLSPEDVFYTYVGKTLDVEKKLNCCTGILLESFDQLKTLESKREGLLYGVPVSIKENYGYKNHDSCCGLIARLEKPAQGDCVLVEVLKRQGAIPFVKTNIPQGLLSYECSNPIYGRTVNPVDPGKTSGGSSGGEGALIGGGGSPLGLGSDIGGSVRIPASFCGIAGFKATVGRLSCKGLSSSYRGQKSVRSSPGPLAKDVDSLALCMRALLCDHMFALDPTIPPLPFNTQTYQSSKPLRIGYVECDGFMQPSPSMSRGIREVKALLEQAGHTLVPYTPVKVEYAFLELIVRGVYADGGFNQLKILEGGPVDLTVKAQYYPLHNPIWLKKILSFFLKPLFRRLSLTVNAVCGVRSIPELWKHHAAVEDYISETIAEWRRCNIDVLLCPMIGPAYNFFHCGKNSSILSYTMLYNLLTFPAGSVPVSTVTAEDEEELEHYEGIYRDAYDDNFKQAVSGAVGLPVAVQCVALPWQDELCLRFMKEVETVVQRSKQ